MKTKLITLILSGFLAANSSGPNAGYAHNAPDNNNCTSCHSGYANSGDGAVTLSLIHIRRCRRRG